MSSLDDALTALSETQKQAVAWKNDALLVLAGPGSGKTQILTCRIASLLRDSEGSSFRVLALTFTNRAADEMKSRVAEFAPGEEERATIGTIHSFCAQVLRQHGVHIGIQPDFHIYGTSEEREGILVEAVKGAGLELMHNDIANYLPVIDRLKSNLVSPDMSEKYLSYLKNAQLGAKVYAAFEAKLRELNALDFHSLILESYQLFHQFPALAKQFRVTHPYWLLDEFQDTSTAQYRLFREMAGSQFTSVFVVADDDQIIYEWNGASYKQIQSFVRDFGAHTLQLPTNYRCPPEIVAAANRLVVYNAQRAGGKAPLVSGKQMPDDGHVNRISVISFDEDRTESDGVAAAISAQGNSTWSKTAVLARARYLLDGVAQCLAARDVPVVILQRRDEFLSPHFCWLHCLLRQLVRPTDRRNLEKLVDSFNRVAGVDLVAGDLLTAADAASGDALAVWEESLDALKDDDPYNRLVSEISILVKAGCDEVPRLEPLVEALIPFAEEDSDFGEDKQAWSELCRDIGRQIGASAPLGQFLQELQLRSKEPVPKAGAVSLMTIHAAKGKEYDIVYVVGLAEDIMPSFQSKRRGDKSPEMEEERRNCFVAITRAKERLILSHAIRYKGWQKARSRFLTEMAIE